MAKAAQKKKWFTLVAPKLFSQKEIGQTPSLESDKVVGRTLKTNLATLNDEVRKQNTEISLIVDKIEGDKAQTSIIGLRLMPTTLKRFVRKGRSRIDEVVTAITKDEKVVTIKSMLLTQNVVQGSVKTGLHLRLRQLIVKKVSQSEFSALAEEVVTGKLHKEIRSKLKKVYPLKTSEILAFKLERNVKASDLRKIKESTKKAEKAKIVEPEKEEAVEEEVKEEVQQTAEKKE